MRAQHLGRAYTADEDMQQLGTAAVHLLTIATHTLPLRHAKLLNDEIGLGICLSDRFHCSSPCDGKGRLTYCLIWPHFCQPGGCRGPDLKCTGVTRTLIVQDSASKASRHRSVGTRMFVKRCCRTVFNHRSGRCHVDCHQ